MAHMTQERKAKIAKQVKPLLAKYSMKGSLSVRNNMTIVLTLGKGKIDFIGDMNNERDNLLGSHTVDKDSMRERYSLNINPYWYHEHYTGETLAFLSEVVPALKSADWYDESDIQSDYFNTAYYFDVQVGTWDKPYVVTK